MDVALFVCVIVCVLFFFGGLLAIGEGKWTTDRSFVVELFLCSSIFVFIIILGAFE